MITVIATLAKREWIRFFRQPHRVVGSVAQPLLFWIFLGFGFSASFKAPGMEGVSYLEYFYPGILLMVVLFSGIFSTITIIEDRSKGLLQSVLVAPVSRMAIVLGKVAGSMGIGLAQAFLMLLAIPFLGLSLDGVGWLLLTLGLILSSLGFTALGFVIAWNMDSTAGFHAIMSVFLLPLWMLSGALFPMGHLPGWLSGLILVNPVSHALQLIRLPFYYPGSQLLGMTDYRMACVVAVAWAGLCLFLALWKVSRMESGVLRSVGTDLVTVDRS
ncbi:MAG: Transport permease protein [Magnetococcales bacterium]|nr:Transport permease protein [Magnetococcales bacterium]HIJ83503.1 ABC transporter permease [Magnetococcales bacterium]